MRAAPISWCLWPGLARLWRAGDWSALAVALGFAGLLNATLLATFVWREPFSSWAIGTAWSVLSVSWGLGIVRGRRKSREKTSNAPSAEDQALFLQAQTEYLRGHWFEAQSVLEKLLARHPADVESRLLLATLYRRTKRVAEAQQQLELIQGSPGFHRWYLEVAQERRLVQQVTSSAEGGMASGSPS